MELDIRRTLPCVKLMCTLYKFLYSPFGIYKFFYLYIVHLAFINSLYKIHGFLNVKILNIILIILDLWKCWNLFKSLQISTKTYTIFDILLIITIILFFWKYFEIKEPLIWGSISDLYFLLFWHCQFYSSNCSWAKVTPQNLLPYGYKRCCF